MAIPITIAKARYYPAHDLFAQPPDPIALQDVQRRRSFLKGTTIGKLNLDQTVGGFVEIAGNPVLIVVDLRTVQPGSAEWEFIGAVARHLVDVPSNLNPDGQAAIAALLGVVFTSSPARAYADVKPRCFVYDVDEFRRSDGSLVTAAWATSNIVHDANHIRMWIAGEDFAGVAAEQTCWALQIANAEALGLDSTEVDFLHGLIADPSSVIARIESDPNPTARLACKEQGKCSVTGAA